MGGAFRVVHLRFLGSEGEEFVVLGGSEIEGSDA
jgi:hypothetical protein